MESVSERQQSYLQMYSVATCRGNLINIIVSIYTNTTALLKCKQGRCMMQYSNSLLDVSLYQLHLRQSSTRFGGVNGYVTVHATGS